MKRIKIFLINAGRWRPMFPQVSPPLGILYLKSYLESKMDCEIRHVNQKLKNTSNDDVVKMAEDFGADVIGYTSLTPTSFGLRYLTKAMRERLPDALQVLGGPHVNSYRDMALRDSHADAAVEGEGELAMEQIINAYMDGDPGLTTVPGIWRRDESGEVVQNPGEIPLIKELDDLPFPDYDALDLPAYWAHMGFATILDRQYISLFSSRGCPYLCNYCHDVFGKRFRQHSAERVVAEIEYFQKRFGVNEFEFFDDIFNLNPKRVLDFTDLLKKKNINIRMGFPNGVRTDIFRRDTLDAMIDAGMYFCCYALESGSPRIQKSMGKNLDIDRFLENVEYAQSRGVYGQGFAMMGFPGETEEDLQMTVDAACSSKLHTLSVFIATPYPNTPLHEYAQKHNPEALAKIDYQDMDYASVFVNLSAVSDNTLFDYQRKINRKFYMNPSRAIRVLKDYPNSKTHYLAHHLPTFLSRVTKGLIPKFRMPQPVATSGG